MAVEFVPVANRVYVKINGVLGSKASSTQADAKTYADRVVGGLARFEPLADTAISHITRNKSLIND